MSKYAHLSDEEMFAQYQTRLPSFRKNLARLTSLLKAFFGKAFSAFATDVIVQDMSGRDDDGNSGDSLTVSGFKAPSAAKLRKFIDAQTYADDLDFLEEMLARMKRSSSDMKDRYPEAKRLRDAMLLTFNTSLDGLTEVAEKTIPDNIGSLFKLSEKALSKVGSEIAGVYLSVGAEPEQGIHFVQMLDISNWERESKTAILAVVVTAVMSETTPGNYTTRVYVNVHDKSVLPFRYNLGVEVTGAGIKAIGGKLQKVMEQQLAAHHVVAVIAPVNLPIDDVTVTTLLTDIKGVKGVSVFEDSIEVEIPGDNRTTVGDVVRALNAYPSIRKMLSGDYSARFAPVGDGMWKYSVSRKV
jgi:hypothetical protein